MRQAIITGSSGFIGSKLVKELIASGICVIALGRKDNTSVLGHILPIHDNLTYIQIDMDNISAIVST